VPGKAGNIGEALRKGEKTMERGVWFWLEEQRDALKALVLADMHRMACGWAGKELPTAPMEDCSNKDGKPDLQFPLRSRQNLNWKGFVTRLGH
jgi:hypothetical protein